jgi:hypothetical protein
MCVSMNASCGGVRDAPRRDEAYWLQSQSQAGVRLICTPLKAYMIQCVVKL